MLINDGTLNMDFIMANYCNGKSLYKNIHKIANHFDFAESSDCRQSVSCVRKDLQVDELTKTSVVAEAMQKYLASYPLQDAAIFLPDDLRLDDDKTPEIIGEESYDMELQRQQQQAAQQAAAPPTKQQQCKKVVVEEAVEGAAEEPQQQPVAKQQHAKQQRKKQVKIIDTTSHAHKQKMM